MKELAKYVLLALIALTLIDAFTGGAVLARYQAWRAAAASGGGETGAVRIEPQPAVIEFVEPEVIYTGAVELRPETAVSSPTPPPVVVTPKSAYEQTLDRVDDWASSRPARP